MLCVDIIRASTSSERRSVDIIRVSTIRKSIIRLVTNAAPLVVPSFHLRHHWKGLAKLTLSFITYRVNDQVPGMLSLELSVSGRKIRSHGMQM